MRVKLYRAPRMAAAMAQIRAELGPEALILATRPVAEGVEVTAAIEPAEPPAPPRPDPARAAALAWHGVPEALRPALAAGPLESALAATLRFAELPLDPAAPLLFVGPPGGGKTLTVARLATRLVLTGVTPRVFTADGQRAGAVEQLAAFTRLLGLDLVAAGSAAALSRALARGGAGPVLIDTPGLDPFAPDQRAALAALVEAAGGTVALVLPGGLDPAEAAELAGAYRAAGARLLIATRLDLARRLGGVLAAAGELTLAEAGIGPGAADGLAPLTPALLAGRLGLPTAAPDPPPHPTPDGSPCPGPPATARPHPRSPVWPAAPGFPPGPHP
jgi:flagellar biosynthesis protein FlhF